MRDIELTDTLDFFKTDIMTLRCQAHALTPALESSKNFQ